MYDPLKAKLTKRLKNAFSGQSGLTANGLKATLIDVRDLLELLRESDRYKALKFHCDWILHPKLTGPRTQRIIKAVDAECVDTMARRGLYDWPESAGSDFLGSLSQDFVRAMSSRFTFHEFESELCEFLDRHSIAKLAHPWSGKYRGFELLYCQLIEDRTWEYTNKKDPTRYVNGVRVRMMKHRADGSTAVENGGFPFFLSWTFLWNGESRIILELEFLSKRPEQMQ